MIPHAWMLLPSGRRLDLLNSHPCAWTDADLATRLSRTYRWCSDTCWDRSLSVAQHSFTVLHLRQAASSSPLSASECLRELLHDAEEGLTHYDVPTPLKPLLGKAYLDMIAGLRRCIDSRYNVPKWDKASYAAHKIADRLAAACEARHVVGWSAEDISQALGIMIEPLGHDPVPIQAGMKPWEPWPAALAARLFLEELERLQREMLELAPDECVVTMLPSTRQAGHGVGKADQATFVVVEGGDSIVEGQIVKGVRLDSGSWDLDRLFTVQTDEGELLTVHGWNCHTEVLP